MTDKSKVSFNSIRRFKMNGRYVIDTDAMARRAQAELEAGYARTDAMARRAHAELEAGYARTDAMARRAQEQTRLLMKNPLKELDDIRFH